MQGRKIIKPLKKELLNINLTSYEGVSEIRIFDVNGKQVSSQRTANNKTVVNISKLAQGVYLIKVITANGEVLNKTIVKQ